MVPDPVAVLDLLDSELSTTPFFDRAGTEAIDRNPPSGGGIRGMLMSVDAPVGGRVDRASRWVATVGLTIAVFAIALWGFHFATFSWLPRNEADRWVVATGLATVSATAVGAALAWWAGRENQPSPQAQNPDGVRQSARASGEGQIAQIGGDQHGPSSQGRRLDGVRQSARASGHGRITQVGGDQRTPET